MSSQDSNQDNGHAEPVARKGISRRRLFGAAGAGAVAVGAGAVAGRLTAPDPTSGYDDVVPFRGAVQAGIVTPVQDRMHFAAFDVTTDSREELVALLRKWTAMAERMTAGKQATEGGAVDAGEYRPPDDTGEALDLDACRLTLTIGFGPSLFVGADGKDRFGIAGLRPQRLTDLPKFTGDALDPARSGGDICIQACADDPQVAVHAIRNLARVGFGTVAVKWSQLGFGRTSSTSTSQSTPRNLFGFKDGTRNIKAEDPAAVSEFVWAAPIDDQAWMAGGSYLVARRIRMLIEPWDRTVLHEQERVIGRSKGSGAPLGGRDEFDPLELEAKGAGGKPVIDTDSHVRLASAEELGGIQILRRGYNFTDGSDGFGHLDAGLFFIAYCRDPQTQFVPMQQSLARNDALNEYIKHVGSAVFAVPPGVGDAGYWGSTLFGDAGPSVDDREAGTPGQ
ncbi:iron uptake transporter deferrochelatase/peroxidase subunit [Rhodococcus tukisamuensis]|uniref:Deferrochelatase n=1 Tax=Rhodococcus tukisamuensis TaxID=168276 RepID=A0A1G7ANV8_9NOCA|nr:iron uptake transporter deferrochelatase/peroxidase subunit [Rhodococcus tukisamuensis]SDE16491.1 deferrochelatase/peroxidase EfeB [Rhodococcus tukisamuensis]